MCNCIFGSAPHYRRIDYPPFITSIYTAPLQVGLLSIFSSLSSLLRFSSMDHLMFLYLGRIGPTFMRGPLKYAAARHSRGLDVSLFLGPSIWNRLLRSLVRK